MEEDEERSENGESILAAIRGARLSSVQFVLCYLILGFDNAGALTTMVWPVITRNGLSLTFGEAGYRDGLCELIGRAVERVEIYSDETIVIEFANDALITIPLRSYTLHGERAIFVTPKHSLFVW